MFFAKIAGVSRPDPWYCSTTTQLSCTAAHHLQIEAKRLKDIVLRIFFF